MKRHSILAFASVVLLSGVAGAEPFGKTGQIAVGAGPLLAVAQADLTATLDTPAGDYEIEQKETHVGLFDTDGAQASLHYVVSNGITIGGTVQYKNKTGEVKDKPPGSPSSSADLPTETRVTLAVAVGYAAMFSPNVGIWPLAGLGYRSNTEEDDATKTSASGPLLEVSVPLVLSPVEHFAFTLGPSFTLPVAMTIELKNKATGQTVDGSLSGYTVGVGAGLMGWF